MLLLILLLVYGPVGHIDSQHIIDPVDFPKTTELIMDLSGVIGESSALQSCVQKVASPLDKAIKFANDVAEIDDKIRKIEQRTEVTVGILEAVMMIPYVGQVASVVLQPAVVVLNTINSGVSKVEPIVGKFAGLLHEWTEPLKTAKTKVNWVTKIIGNFSNVVIVADAKASAAEGCVDSLPAGRSKAIRVLEGLSNKLDVIPDGFNHVLGATNKACSKAESFLSKLHLLNRRRGLPRLSTVIHVLDAILNAFGPLGHFLDKVDHVLHKKFCLLHSLGKVVEEVGELGEKVIKGAVHVGKEVVKGVEHLGKEIGKGVEHLGKEVGKGVKHFVDEAGQVWEEVEGGVEHVAHEIGKGVEHAGKEIVKGAEHVVHEVGKGVEHVAHEVGKGVEHVAHEVGKGAEHVAHEVGKGVEHVAHEVGKGAEHVAHEVGKGVSHVAHEVSHAVHHIGHVFHHIFGRRAVAERVYLIDGKLYILVDGSVDTRTRRGFDVCIRLSDILKGVNFVTGGLMSKAMSLIDEIFHGKSPFHIPGLTSDVLNIGSLFHNLNFAQLLPSIKDLIKLPQMDIEKILKLNLQLFEMLLPECAMAFAKVDMDFK